MMTASKPDFSENYKKTVNLKAEELIRKSVTSLNFNKQILSTETVVLNRKKSTEDKKVIMRPIESKLSEAKTLEPLEVLKKQNFNDFEKLKKKSTKIAEKSSESTISDNQNKEKPKTPTLIRYNKSPIKLSEKVSNRLSIISNTLKISNNTIFGLENPRYQCYLNTVLQCFLSLKDVINTILATNSSTPLIESIKKLIFDSKTANVLSSRPFLSIFLKNFSPYTQHDAPEFFRIFLDKLNTDFEAKKPTKEKGTP